MKTADEILHEHGIAPRPPGKQRYYTTCPQCSARRSRAHQSNKVLGVTVLSDGVKWGCNHCLWSGGAYYNGKISGHDGQPAITYDYTNERGNLLFQKVRNPPGNTQRFWQRRPDGKGGWINNTQGIRKVLYRLPELIEAIASERTILVVEGEKDADSLWRIGIPATCSPDGASDIGKAAKWHRAYSESLRGADLVVIPDHDAAGYAHADATVKTSIPVTKRVRLLTLAKHWPECPKGGDVSDWLAAGHTREELDALIERAPDHGTTEGPDYGSALRLTFFDECNETAPKRWLIKNVIALGETSSWIAPPGRGKSALHSDICVHLAAGKAWRGHKTKGRFGCVYFAFERADLVKRRNAAYAKRYGFKGLPIAVAAQIIDLMHPDCVNVILATIRAAEERFSVPVRYIVIDTFAKGIAAAGGDEDKARDQNKCLTNLRRLHEQADLHIAIVGHTGKDETRGSRGSNAHPADADLQVQIFGDGDKIKNARVIKGNDQPEGELTAFKLKSADLGIDEDGDPITTAILSNELFSGQMTQKAARKLSPRYELAVRALSDLSADQGAPPPASWGLPNSISTVSVEAWHKMLLSRDVLHDDDDRRVFWNMKDRLKAKNLVAERDGLVWAA